MEPGGETGPRCHPQMCPPLGTGQEAVGAPQPSAQPSPPPPSQLHEAEVLSSLGNSTGLGSSVLDELCL